MIHKLLKRQFGRRGAFALEFALVAPVFLVLLFVVFEVSYDEFMQEVLDNALQSSARQVQIGNTQTATSGTFVQNYFCPYDDGLINCNSLYVRIQSVSFGSGSCSNLDFYDATVPGGAPSSGSVLQLGAFYNGAGNEGNGANSNMSPCATPNSSSGYCNAGSQEFILMTAIYVAPSFLGGLLPYHFTYGGSYVRPIYSSAAFQTEPFASTSPLNPC